MTTVLQIIPNLGAGGAEQACVDVAAGLVAAGHRALVVSGGGPRAAEIEKSGGEHILHRVNTKNPARMLANARWLARLIREQKVDIIHARSRAPAWTAYWASRMVLVGFMTTFHAAYKFSNPFKKFYNSVMAKGDRVVAISHFLAQHIADSYGIGADRIRTIPRGIDLDKFAPEKITAERQNTLRAAWGVAPGQPLILMPSRVSPIKGQAILIAAMALLPPQFRDITAVILGDDQGRSGYRRELEQQITASNLEDRVRMVAHCNDMPAAYSLAGLVVAPSLVPEGFGRVPVEAMAMGIPAVASRLGGFCETVISGETGFLVPPGDPEELADAIMQALALAPDKRAVMAEAGMKEARARYDKRKMVADTLAVYAEVMQIKRT